MKNFSDCFVPFYLGDLKKVQSTDNISIERVLMSERGFLIYDFKNIHLYISNGEMALILNGKNSILKKLKKTLSQQDYRYLIRLIKEMVKRNRMGFSLNINLKNNRTVLISTMIVYKEGVPHTMLCIFEDQEIKLINDLKFNRNVKLLAYYDDVTGLPNRNYINEIIKNRMGKAQKLNSNFWIMFAEVSNFGFINELFGHATGDEFLKIASLEIKKAIPREWVVGRFGADEFVIITTSAEREVIIKKSLELIDKFATKWEVMGKTFFTNINIGIAGFPGDGDNVSELLKNAEAALTWAKKQAKELGKGQYEFYNSKIVEDILNRVELENEILKGIQKRQFFLVYQPKFSVNNLEVVGFEALLRWNSDKGVLTPDKFINIAEESGLIYELNKLVVEMLCNDVSLMKTKGLAAKTVAINLSGKEFALYNMVATLSESLKRYALKPDDIEIEITERTILNDIELSKTIFKELSDLGIKISIDDFGTGFSSFELLLSLPLNALKIDKKFINRVEFFKNEYVITKNIIHMAKELNLKTIAEGVERKQQFDILKNLGCDEVQGFLFAKPMKADEIIKFLNM